MIRDVVYAIENKFATSWLHGEVNYNEENFTPQGSEWLEIIIAPVVSEVVSTDNCTDEFYDLQVMAYGSQKVESGELLDNAILFLQNTYIDGVKIKSWRVIANGVLESGTYFYKISFDVQY